MNNLKKIGLTALAGSLVATSVAVAGEMSASGSASMKVTNNSQSSAGKTVGMANSVVLAGSGELDNGMTVSMSFEMDQGTANNSSLGFDSHSVTISSDSMGSVKFSGHGGSSATSAMAGTAAGSIWDNFDGTAKKIGAATVSDALVSNGGGNNTFFYTSPAVMDGVSITASWNPHAAAGVNSMLGLGVTYTGVEGLSVSYGVGDATTGVSTTEADATTMKASYAVGPGTLAYSEHSYDSATATRDQDTKSMSVAYTVTDSISVSYGTDELSSNESTTAVDAVVDSLLLNSSVP